MTEIPTEADHMGNRQRIMRVLRNRRVRRLQRKRAQVTRVDHAAARPVRRASDRPV